MVDGYGYEMYLQVISHAAAYGEIADQIWERFIVGIVRWVHFIA